MTTAPDLPLPHRRLLRWLARLAVLASVAWLAISLTAHVSYRPLWDDSYMWVRYADNVLDGHGLRWNPQDAPSYGLTSLAYFVPVLGLRALFPDNDHLPIALGSLGCGVLLLGLLWRLVRRRAVPSKAWVLPLLVLFGYAVGVPGTKEQGLDSRPCIGLASHFVKGMDTPLALCALTIFLGLLLWLEARPSRGRGIVVGVWGGLLFLVRPDLMLFAVGVPGWMMLTSSRLRGPAIACLATTAGVLGATLLTTHLTFGSALPLPFYAKSTRSYGDVIYEQYRDVATTQASIYLKAYWLLFALAFGHATLGVRNWWRTTSPAEKGLLLGIVAFTVYYTFFVLQIMHGNQRFYYPTFPPLLYLAARSTVEMGRALSRVAARVPATVLTGCGALVLLAITAHLGWHTKEHATRLWFNFERGKLFEFPNSDAHGKIDGFADGEASWQDRVFGGARLSDIPGDMTIAASEIGYLSVRARGKRLIDLAGLHDTDFARNGFSVDRLLNEDRPDVLILPHVHYTSIRQAINEHPRWKAEYDFLGRAVGFPLSVRKDSPHADTIRAIAADAKQRLIDSLNRKRAKGAGPQVPAE